MAVVASIINSWCKGKWKPGVWQLDLYDGPKNLLNALSSYFAGEKAFDASPPTILSAGITLYNVGMSFFDK